MSWSYIPKDRIFILDDSEIEESYNWKEHKVKDIICFVENPLIKFVNTLTTSLDLEYYKVLERLNS